MAHYVHNIDPVLVSIGSVKIRYYGLMYLTGFVVGYFIFKWRHRRGYFGLSPIQVQDLFTYLMFGMMIGARLAYVFIYNWDSFKDNLVEIFYIWQGGLSFHGALLGFTFATWLFCRKYKFEFWHVVDHVCIGSALGIFFGRLGNFANGELWGRPSEVPWAMIFPKAGSMPRHPSQLYQALCEGLLVFFILLWIDSRERKKHLVIETKKNGSLVATWDRTGVIAGSFLMLYGVARFMMEFFREPDSQLGFYWNYFSMGQILCFLMIIPGAIIVYRRIQNPIPQTYTVPAAEVKS